MKSKVAIVVTVLILCFSIQAVESVSESEMLDKLLESLKAIPKALSTLLNEHEVITKRLELMDTRLEVIRARSVPTLKVNAEILLVVKGLEKEIAGISNNVIQLNSQINQLKKEVETLKATMTKSKVIEKPSP